MRTGWQSEARETGIRRLSLRFTRADLEAEFDRAYVRRFLPHTRVALVLALVLYAGFGAIDPFLIPRTTAVAWAVRFGIGVPLLLLALALSFVRSVDRWLHWVWVALGTVIGLSIVAMIWNEGSAASHQYYVGLMLVCVYLYVFVRLRFVLASVSCWGITVVYELVAVTSGVLPTPMLVGNSIFLLSINVVGMSVCYSMEWSLRLDFLRQRLIDRQAGQLRGALAELEHRNAELDSFVYSVSHDLKAPLVTIGGFAQMLREEYGPRLDDAGRRLLQRIEANTRRVEHLVHDVLALSRIGREAPVREWVDVDGLVSRLVEEFAAQRGGVHVVKHRLPPLWALPAQADQIFANLVGNAFKYLGEGPDPTIEIGAIDGGEVLEFYVRDSGIGIDPVYHAKVFEVFQRLDTHTDGTGVGLTIVKRAVELNGGRIWLESQPGCGATFRFTWPNHAAAEIAGTAGP